MFILLTIALTACYQKGDKGDTGSSGKDGKSIVFTSMTANSSQCTTGGSVMVFAKDDLGTGLWDASDSGQMAIVVCNGSQGIQGPQGPTGPQGLAGSNGSNGSNGHSAAFSETVADVTACPTGGTVINMGIDANGNSVLEVSEITQVAIVCNGLNGIDAHSAQFIPVMPITPCGSNSSPDGFKEVLLALSGGGILSEFTGNTSDAGSVRNTLIPDGSYYDTDAGQCNFSVSTDSNGNRSVNWNGSTHNGSAIYNAGQASYASSTMSWVVSY